MRFRSHAGLRLFQLREEYENPHSDWWVSRPRPSHEATNGDKLRRIIYNSTKTDKKRRNKNLHNEKWHHPKKGSSRLLVWEVIVDDQPFGVKWRRFWLSICGRSLRCLKGS